MSKRLFTWLLIIVICLASSFAFSQSNQLTKEKITQIAISKAKDLGYKIEEMNIIYDEGNKSIKEHSRRVRIFTYDEKTKKWEKDLSVTPEKEHPELRGKDYQSVYLGPKESGAKGGDLWVFIDKNTGDVIKYSRGK
jgi:hypothetical protein